MAGFIVQQPNGLYCRFSTIVGCPTHWDMTREEYLDNITGTVNNYEEGIDILDNYLYPFHELIHWYEPINMVERDFVELLQHMVQPTPDKYEIPKNKKALLTDDFLMAFKQELEGKYGVKLEDNTYDNFYIQIMSTLGFYQALESACRRFNIKEELYDYVNSLEWYHSDEFDVKLVGLMLERGIIEK